MAILLCVSATPDYYEIFKNIAFVINVPEANLDLYEYLVKEYVGRVETVLNENCSSFEAKFGVNSLEANKYKQKCAIYWDLVKQYNIFSTYPPADFINKPMVNDSYYLYEPIEVFENIAVMSLKINIKNKMVLIIPL